MPTSQAQVKNIGAIQGNSAFDVILVPQFPAPGVPNSAGVLELAGGSVFGTITSQSATNETVLLPLGTFNFTAGNVSGEINHLMASNTTIDGTTPSANNVTFSGLTLDPLLQPGSATITVTGTAVPEPIGLTLALLGGLASAVVQQRRARAAR